MKDVVADALSRDPFAKKECHRLLIEQYSRLLIEMECQSRWSQCHWVNKAACDVQSQTDS